MKNLVLILCLLLLIASCDKPLEDFPEPHGYDTITPSDTDTFVNPLAYSTWFITEYRIGPVGNNQFLNDELKFYLNNLYYYNGYTTKYSLTQTIDGYMLTLYETRWGNISGFIYNSNLAFGEIEGIEFKNIMNNKSNSIYLWIKKM